MSSATQFSLSLKEIGETLLRKEGVTTGKWMVGVNFGIQVGNINLSPESAAKPSASVLVEGFNVSKLPNEQAIPAEIESLIIDASTLK